MHLGVEGGEATVHQRIKVKKKKNVSGAASGDRLLGLFKKKRKKELEQWEGEGK